MNTMLMPLFTAPTIEFSALAPILIVFGAACIGVLVDAIMIGRLRGWRDEVQMGLVIGSTLGAFAYVVWNARKGVKGPLAMGSIMLDGPTYVAWGALLVFGLLAIMVFRETKVNGGVTAFASSAATVPGSAEEVEADRYRLQQTEIFPLALFSIVGMMVFASANDLLTLFVGLEVFSLPLYLMCGMARRRRLVSQEASLKYFLLGALSSAFFLFGVALVYAYAGSFKLGDIATKMASPTYGSGLLYTGLILLASGLRLLLGPLIALGLVVLLGLSGLTRQVAIVQSAMPTAVVTGVLASEFGADTEFVTATILVSTVTSVATLTILLAVIM